MNTILFIGSSKREHELHDLLSVNGAKVLVAHTLKEAKDYIGEDISLVFSPIENSASVRTLFPDLQGVVYGNGAPPLHTLIQAMNLGYEGYLSSAMQTSEMETIIARAQERRKNHLDELTQLKAVSTLEHRFHELTRLHEKSRVPISLLYFDVDSFKEFNESFGHKLGDIVLTTIGHIFRQNCRPYDVASRKGGDEFILLLAGTEETAAYQRAAKLQEIVQQIPLTELLDQYGKSFSGEEEQLYHRYDNLSLLQTLKELGYDVGALVADLFALQQQVVILGEEPERLEALAAIVESHYPQKFATTSVDVAVAHLEEDPQSWLVIDYPVSARNYDGLVFYQQLVKRIKKKTPRVRILVTGELSQEAPKAITPYDRTDKEEFLASLEKLGEGINCRQAIITSSSVRGYINEMFSEQEKEQVKVHSTRFGINVTYGVAAYRSGMTFDQLCDHADQQLLNMKIRRNNIA